MPAVFVPLAERLGLSARLSLCVLDRVLRDLASIELPPDVRCYVNVPAHLLDDVAFLRDLHDRLNLYPGLVNHLGIEVTESEAMQNVPGIAQALHRIRERGLRIAIDDFGTGYSSMAYLKRFPVDLVKIDRSFVDDLPNDERDVALASAFLVLAQQFGFVSLAEGVERENQAQWLAEHGCVLGQGFLVSPSLSFDEFARAIAVSGVIGESAG